MWERDFDWEGCAADPPLRFLKKTPLGGCFLLGGGTGEVFVLQVGINLSKFEQPEQF